MMQFKFNIPIYNLDVTTVTIYDKYDAPELKKLWNTTKYQKILHIT